MPTNTDQPCSLCVHENKDCDEQPCASCVKITSMGNATDNWEKVTDAVSCRDCAHWDTQTDEGECAKCARGGLFDVPDAPLLHRPVLLPPVPPLNPAEPSVRSVDFHGEEVDPDGINAHAPGAKLDAGKVKAGILADFGLALMAVAEVGTFGADKYSRGGWLEVENGEERYTDAMWRHLLKENTEPLDDDSELEHIAHFAWNVLARLEFLKRKQREEAS